MSDTETQHAFGWAPVGARLLREYSTTAGTVESAPTVKYAKTWKEIKALPVMQQLVSLAVQQMVMLHAVDTVPRGKCCLLGTPPTNPTIAVYHTQQQLVCMCCVQQLLHHLHTL
jgi:hypothetical protein